MKHLTKIFTLALVLCSAALFAQVNFGVKAGLNLTNLNISGASSVVNDYKKMLITFQVGGIAEFDLAEKVALETDLLLVGKGIKLEEGGDKITNNPFYLQIPVLVLYKDQMFYIGGGPYVGLGIFGKQKTEFGGDTESSDIKFGNSDDDNFAPFDFGLQFEGGVIINNSIRISAGYGLGLTNVIPSDARVGDDDSAKHGVISINAAYMFDSSGGDK